jgi:DNA modification methylase
MGTDKAQLILADPPYCLLKRRRKNGRERDPKRHKIYHEAVRRFEDLQDFYGFTKGWVRLAAEHLSETGVFVVWTNFLGGKPVREVAAELDLHHHGDYVWAKLTKEGSGNERVARIYEFAPIFGRQKAPVVTPDATLPPRHHISGYDSDKEASTWGSHPNHKAFRVLEPLIRYYSKPGDRVLDPFTGSGSTPAASIRLGRMVSGLELREQWAEVSQRRMAAQLSDSSSLT